MVDQSPKYSRRIVALFWLLVVGIVIGVLLYLEQIAVLYVLATLSLVALLLVVGFADLEHVGIEGGNDLSPKAE
jgi:hypothetical protein